MNCDYESWGQEQIIADQEQPMLLEAYQGAQIVAWYGNIERQISGLIERYESTRNFPYVDKLRAFLNTWRQYPITGSINRETLDPLESACNILAVDSWKLSNFYSNLRDQIRKLIASEEQLPRIPSAEPMNTGGGGSRASSVSSSPAKEEQPPSEFGPEEKSPAGATAPTAGAPEEKPLKVKKP